MGENENPTPVDGDPENGRKWAKMGENGGNEILKKFEFFDQKSSFKFKRDSKFKFKNQFQIKAAINHDCKSDCILFFDIVVVIESYFLFIIILEAIAINSSTSINSESLITSFPSFM